MGGTDGRRRTDGRTMDGTPSHEDMGTQVVTEVLLSSSSSSHALSNLCLSATDKEVVVSGPALKDGMPHASLNYSPPPPPPFISQLCREADSLTLYPGVWFGLLSSPCLVSLMRETLIMYRGEILSSFHNRHTGIVSYFSKLFP